MAGRGLEALPAGREAFLEGQEGSGGPTRGPSGIGRTSQMAREGSGGPHKGLRGVRSP